MRIIRWKIGCKWIFCRCSCFCCEARGSEDRLGCHRLLNFWGHFWIGGWKILISMGILRRGLLKLWDHIFGSSCSILPLLCCRLHFSYEEFIRIWFAGGIVRNFCPNEPQHLAPFWLFERWRWTIWPKCQQGPRLGADPEIFLLELELLCTGDFFGWVEVRQNSQHLQTFLLLILIKIREQCSVSQIIYEGFWSQINRLLMLWFYDWCCTVCPDWERQRCWGIHLTRNHNFTGIWVWRWSFLRVDYWVFGTFLRVHRHRWSRPRFYLFGGRPSTMESVRGPGSQARQKWRGRFGCCWCFIGRWWQSMTECHWGGGISWLLSWVWVPSGRGGGQGGRGRRGVWAFDLIS